MEEEKWGLSIAGEVSWLTAFFWPTIGIIALCRNIYSVIESPRTINAIQFLEEMQTSGHHPLKVLGEDFEVYIAKSGKGHNPPLSILNEFICSFFLRLWEISSPEPVFLQMNPDLIDRPLSTTNFRTHYSSLCFGSKFLQDSIDLNQLFSISRKSDLNRLERPTDLLWITVFDIWVANEDRSPFNQNMLLASSPRTDKLTIFAIDHAQAFLFMNYRDLNPGFEGEILPIGNSIIDSDWGKSFAKFLREEDEFPSQETILQKVERCRNNFERIESVLRAKFELQSGFFTPLKTFLFDEERIDKVVSEFFSRF